MELIKTRKNVYAIYFVSILCFLLILAGSYLNIQKSNEKSKTLNENVIKLNKLQSILIDVQSIESGARGYVITGKKDFLENFKISLDNLKEDTIFIRKEFLKNASCENLINNIRDKAILSSETVKMRDEFGEDSTDAYIRNGRGLVLMNDITNVINLLKNEPIREINNYNAINNNLIFKRKLNYFLLIFILMFASISTFYFFERGFNAQFIREKKLKFNSALLSNLYDPVITTDNNYIITSWNKNAEKLFGYKEQEALGMRLKNLLRSETKNESLEAIRSIISQNEKWNGDIIYLSKDDKKIFANVSTSLVYDERNQLNGTVSIIRDMTEKTIAENQLQLLSDNLEKEVQNKVAEIKTVFERTTDAFVSFDNDLNYVFVNEKAASLHFSSVKEMMGKNILDYTPQRSSPEFYEALKEVLRNKKEIHNELQYRKTGQWFENWIYPDNNGVSVYYRDITNRKNEETRIVETNKTLETLNNRFELILKGTNDAIWDWDMNSNEVWGNEKYYEMISNKPEGKSNYEFFRERMDQTDMKKGFAMIEKAIAEKKTTTITEYKFLNPDNKWIVVFNRQTIVYDEFGKPYRILGVLQDITEQRKIQEQIIHEKEMSDVLINSLPGVFYMFNKEGKYIKWNKNLLDLSGLKDEDMISTANPVNFVPDEQRQLFAEKIANVFKAGYDFVEGDLLVANNKRIPYYFTGIYIKYNGEDCMMGVGIDISEKIKTQSELRELAKHLQNIREEERTRIAREIHDELGQQLTGLKMEIAMVNKKLHNISPDLKNKMEDSLLLIDDTVKIVRRISTQLRPGILDDLGLISAIEWQCEEFEKRFHIETRFKTVIQQLDIDKEKTTALFRILQESLTNVLRHSKANNVNVYLNKINNHLEMKIEDNGIGFDINSIKNMKTLGILGMKERAFASGGNYEILSEPNKGTRVLVNLPLDA